MSNASASEICALAKRSSGDCAPGVSLLLEVNGALGDLGTFLPVVIGLACLSGFDVATVLVFAGLMNIMTALVFRIPVAVQPMKAIAALAIAGGLTASQAGIAGLTVAVSLLLLLGTGLIGWMDRVIPRAALRAVQLCVAITLAMKGLALGVFNPGESSLRSVWACDGLALFAAALVLLVCLRKRMPWFLLGLVCLGVITAAATTPGLFVLLRLSVWHPRLVRIDMESLAGIWRGGLPQLPLTMLNSVFAAALVAERLFGDRGRRASSSALAMSVAVMNLLTLPFGAMPVCHGAGGLAAQHRLGARTGLSMVMLGAVKLLTGLLFGAAALAWMQAFPAPLLGTLLIMAALALAQASGLWDHREDWLAAGAAVVVGLGTGFLLAGFAAAWLVHVAAARYRRAGTPASGDGAPHHPSRRTP